MKDLKSQLQSVADVLNFETEESRIAKFKDIILNTCRNSPDLPNAKIKTIAKSGSIYIEFDVPFHTTKKFGQLRIGDHPEKKYLGYRWQVRTDVDSHFTQQKEGKTHTQFIFSLKEQDELFDKMREFYSEISMHLSKHHDDVTIENVISQLKYFRYRDLTKNTFNTVLINASKFIDVYNVDYGYNVSRASIQRWISGDHKAKDTEIVLGRLLHAIKKGKYNYEK